MKLRTNIRDLGWWLTAVILSFIITSMLGWEPGYAIVIVLSAFQMVFFSWRERSLTIIPAQVRLVYFGLTLFGLWPGVRIWVYMILLIGTFMVVFFDRCSIEYVLRRMPWN